MDNYKEELKQLMKNGPYAWSTLARDIGISANTMKKILEENDPVISFAVIRKIKAFMLKHANLVE